MALPYDAERVMQLRSMLREARKRCLPGWRSGEEFTALRDRDRSTATADGKSSLYEIIANEHISHCSAFSETKQALGMDCL